MPPLKAEAKLTLDDVRDFRAAPGKRTEIIEVDDHIRHSFIKARLEGKGGKPNNSGK